MAASGQIRIGAQRHNHTHRWMGWRRFITLISGLAIAWPLACYAQEPSQQLKRVGVLAAYSTCPIPPNDPVIRRLRELGWIEGKTFAVECVSTVDRVDQLPALARELVSRRPDVLIAFPTQFIMALKQETTTIPIVMATTWEPGSATRREFW